MKIFATLKKLTFFSFFCLLVWAGCKKTEKETIIEPQMTKFEANPTEIMVGESVTLSWEGIGDYAVVNDITVPISGSMVVSPTVNTTYKAQAWNSQRWKSEPPKTVLVKVNQPPVYTRTDTLCTWFKWGIDSTKVYLPQYGIWDKVDYNATQLSHRTDYHADGNVFVLDSLGNVIANGHWGWKGNDSIQKSTEAYRYKFGADTTLVLNSRNGTIIDYYKGYPK